MQTFVLLSYLKTSTATVLATAGPKLAPGLLNLGFVLAQAGGTDFDSGASSALSTVMKIGFLLGVVVIAGGGMAIRGGRAEEGKMAIVGGLIIAGAPAILKALFTAFGLSGSSVSVGQ